MHRVCKWAKQRASIEAIYYGAAHWVYNKVAVIRVSKASRQKTMSMMILIYITAEQAALLHEYKMHLSRVGNCVTVFGMDGQL